jgi:hypothetical protein
MSFTNFFLRHFRSASLATPTADVFELRLIGLERHRAASLPGIKLFRKMPSRRAA